jgi:hypothetical protein
MAFQWTCQFCGRPTTITDPHIRSNTFDYHVDAHKFKSSYIRLYSYAISCPNQECMEVTFFVDLHTVKFLGNGEYERVRGLKSCFLLPESLAKPQPNYIPEIIREDYYESCRIRDLSPKASATLARRCLQGMIRDFWDVTNKPNLFKEIEAIKEKVDSVTWEAIDAVRKVGNIGAHMEKDVNLIVEVDPDEAQVLIGLIEILFKDWYVARKEKHDRMNSVIALAKAKKPEHKDSDENTGDIEK